MSAAGEDARHRQRPAGGDAPTVVAIVGSPRRHGNTAYATGLAVAELERRGIGCETISLAKVRLEPCLAHDDCGTRERCPRRDDAEAVFDSVWAATGLILASPVFFATVSAQMKTFMDRTNHRYLHGPALHPKAVGLIAVGGQGGLKDTLRTMERYLEIMCPEMPTVETASGIADKLGDAEKSDALRESVVAMAGRLADALLRA